MGPRLALVAASSALLAAAPPPPPDTAAQQTIAGKWYSYTWGGLVPDDSKRCLLATVLERDYEIVPDAAGVRGIFSSITWTYVFSAQAPCTVGGHELRPAELTSRFWGLSGFGSRTPMRVSAAFQRCMGLYCSSPQTDKKDFTADLRRSGPGLSERDEDNAAWTQSYQRLDTFGKDLGEVREAAERVRAAFASGDSSQVSPLLSSTLDVNQRRALMDSLLLRRDQAKLVESIEPVQLFVMAPGATVRDTRVQILAYMPFVGRRVDDSKFAGHFLFSKEGGHWKFLASS